jgi:hypothetical protein
VLLDFWYCYFAGLSLTRDNQPHCSPPVLFLQRLDHLGIGRVDRSLVAGSSTFRPDRQLRYDGIIGCHLVDQSHKPQPHLLRTRNLGQFQKLYKERMQQCDGIGLEDLTPG